MKEKKWYNRNWHSRIRRREFNEAGRVKSVVARATNRYRRTVTSPIIHRRCNKHCTLHWKSRDMLRERTQALGDGWLRDRTVSRYRRFHPEASVTPPRRCSTVDSAFPADSREMHTRSTTTTTTAENSHIGSTRVFHNSEEQPRGLISPLRDEKILPSCFPCRRCRRAFLNRWVG